MQNDHIVNYFRRGLCQGDSLSPYFFPICTKGLLNLLNQSALNDGTKGIRVCWGTPTINHLLFANDSLIFYKATQTDSQQLLAVLMDYAKVSSQCINVDKTTMVFSQNVKEMEKTEIMTLWGTRDQLQYERYLELPPIVRRSCKRAFSDIKANVWQHL